MKLFSYTHAKKAFLLCILIAFLPMSIFAKDFVLHDALLEDKTVQKINEMGQELFEKTGVQVFLIAQQTSDTSITDLEKNFAKDLSGSYVILALLQNEKKVDIYNSADTNALFDKEAVLSPFPWKGTIIPLLMSKKNETNAEAALLNGYADIIDQIAASKRVTLESSIGNTNKTMISILRLCVYGFLGVMAIMVIYRRMKKHD